MNVDPRAEARRNLASSARLSHIPFLHLAVLEISRGHDAFTPARQVQSAGPEPSESSGPKKILKGIHVPVSNKF